MQILLYLNDLTNSMFTQYIWVFIQGAASFIQTAITLFFYVYTQLLSLAHPSELFTQHWRWSADSYTNVVLHTKLVSYDVTMKSFWLNFPASFRCFFNIPPMLTINSHGDILHPRLKLMFTQKQHTTQHVKGITWTLVSINNMFIYLSEGFFF